MSDGRAVLDILESGPADAANTVLCLPGGMCTAVFYEELMAEPALAMVRLIAVTLPGQGGTAPSDDLGIDSYAKIAAELAAEHGCDAVVGHSIGANVALEMAASGEFSGPLVLLAPSLSRKDEAMFLRVVDRLGVVLGHLPFALVLKVIGKAIKVNVPPERLDELVGEIRKNDPRIVRRHVRSYLQYLDRHGSVAKRLCESGFTAWVVFGEHDDVGITDDERRLLDECPRTKVITIGGAGHMTLNEEPARVAAIVNEALSSVR